MHSNGSSCLISTGWRASSVKLRRGSSRITLSGQVFYARHSGPVWSVAFAPDGKTLLSGGADGLVLTYDLSEPVDAAPELAQAAAMQEDDSRGAELFRKCAACHTVTPDGEHRAGPTLYRLFGRTA